MGCSGTKELPKNTIVPVTEMIQEKPKPEKLSMNKSNPEADVGVIHFIDGTTNVETTLMAGAGAIPNVASDMICKLQKQNNLGEFKKENAIIDGKESNDTQNVIDSFNIVPRQPKETVELIKKSMIGHPIFTNMDEEQIYRIIDAMTPVGVNEDVICSQQSKSGKSFYSIESGYLSMEHKTETEHIYATMGPGYSFGEIFLYDTPRLYTVKAITKCSLWTIHRTTFRRTIELYEKTKIADRLALLSKQSLFTNLTHHELSRLADACKDIEFRENDKIFEVGEEITNESCFYIIVKGKVKLTSPEEKNTVLQEGGFFGEYALITNTPRKSSAFATTACRCLTLNRKSFITLYDSLQSILNLSIDAFSLNVIKEIPLFSVLTETIQQELHAQAVCKNFTAKSLIANAQIGGLYIILEGEIIREMPKDQEVMRRNRICSSDGFEMNDDETIEKKPKKEVMSRARGYTTFDASNTVSLIENRLSDKGYDSEGIREILVKGNYFGGSLLFLKKLIQNKYWSKTDSKLLFISKDIINNMISLHPEMKRVLVKGYNPRKGLQELILTMPKKQDLDMNSFIYIKFLGRGSFGTCFLAKDREGNDVTIKCIERQLLYKKPNEFNEDIVMSGKANSVKIVIQEKVVLSLIPSSHFLEKFYGTSADSHYLYFVLENISGGELEDQIHSREHIGGLSLNSARFYAANIVLMIQHLQNENIVYRDLKPENILLDGKTGYLKLIDFGFAKQLFQRTWTLCGTPYYIAPEILACTGHDFAADWWSLGIIIYEMVSRKPAFAGIDQLQTFALILNGELKFTDIFPPELVELISGLLIRTKTLRLGARQNKALDVINHSFFEKVDWQEMKTLKTPAPQAFRRNSHRDEDDSEFPIYDGDISWLSGTTLENFCGMF